VTAGVSFASPGGRDGGDDVKLGVVDYRVVDGSSNSDRKRSSRGGGG
jgi:hypothetical protein